MYCNIELASNLFVLLFYSSFSLNLIILKNVQVLVFYRYRVLKTNIFFLQRVEKRDMAIKKYHPVYIAQLCFSLVTSLTS